MKIVKLLFIITLLLSPLLNNLSVLDLIIHTVSVIFSILIFSRYPLLPNLAKYIVLFYVWISVVMMPCFHLIYHLTADFVNFHIKQVDYDRVLSFGIRLYCFISFLYLMLGKFKRKNKHFVYIYSPKLIKPKFVMIGFIIFYMVAFFTFYTGISRMGGEPIRLPFHLTGVLNLFQSYLIPVFFAVVIENYILNKKNAPSHYYALFFLWGIIEIFVWMSKGILVQAFLPTLLVLIYYYRPSVKKSLKFVLPIFIVFVFLYPIIGVMRHMDTTSISDVFTNYGRAKSEVDSPGDEPFILITILNRIFMTGFLYGQDFDYIHNSELFDFSKLPLLLMAGGSESFQTHYIDGYGDDAIVGSGMTGIIDPLLHGGYGTCYIMLFVIMLFAMKTDNIIYKRKYSIYAICLLIVWGLCNINISSLYNPIGLQGYFVAFVGVLVAYYLNFRHFRVEVNRVN